MEIDSSLLEKLDAVIKANEELTKINKKQVKEIESLKYGKEKKYVEIGCNLLMGMDISTPNGDIDMPIKFKETISMSSKDIEQILKNGINREFFIKDLIYFVDDSDYELFNIKRKFDISDDNIIKIVNSNDIKKIEKFLNETTTNKIDTNVLHTIFYKIVFLYDNGDIKSMSFDTREFVEKYFNMQIKMASTLYKSIKSIVV